MKKVILLFILPLTICISARSQTYKAGDNIVSVGLGFGGSLGNYGGSTQSPEINAQYERGIWEVGPGVISIGGYLGYKSYKYSDANTTVKQDYTIVGGRGAYHFTGLNIDHLDVYGGIMISYDHSSLSYTYNNGTGNSSYNPSGSGVEVSPFVGGRYYFAGGLGAYAELGFGVNNFNTGLCYRF